MRPCYHVIFGLALSVFAPGASLAHELWIDPRKSGFAPGDTLLADVRVGENMRGGTQIYNPDNYRNLVYAANRRANKITGVLGDRPAIQIKDAADGLHILVLDSTASKVTYKTFDKFARFVTRHDQDFAIAAHRSRGLPDTNFGESYFRFAKALVKVGTGAGADAMAGLAFELTALDNPFTGTGPIRLRLTYKRAPVPDFQIDIFHRPIGETGDASLRHLRTDADGVATLPRARGAFLISAVRLEEPSPRIAEMMNVVWQSLWASTTFRID